MRYCTIELPLTPRSSIWLRRCGMSEKTGSRVNQPCRP
jgi:hypothetical protein